MVAALVLLALVNGQRVAHHERPLRSRPQIGVCGEVQPLRCVHRHGTRTTAVGVITAIGYPTNVAAVVAWLNWPKHRGIMLDRKYTVAGAFERGRFYRVVFAR